MGFLSDNALDLHIDTTNEQIILMGHSSGAHVVTLLGTDPSFMTRAGVKIQNIRGIIALDGSNYNALAEVSDSPGPVAENLISALGLDPNRLQVMSPTYYAMPCLWPQRTRFSAPSCPKAGGRQASRRARRVAERCEYLVCAVHMFEWQGFEGHVQMLLRLGDLSYPTTNFMDEWLKRVVPVA